MECAGCGADLGPTDVACRYCQRPTPYAAVHAREERARQERAAAAQAASVQRERSAAYTELDKLAKRSFIFSLLTLVTCGLPVFPILSILAWRRTRDLARRHSVDVPGRATFGLVLSSLALVLLPVSIVVGIVTDNASEARTAQRIGELETKVAATASAPTLDWQTACSLAELYALRNGYSEQRGKNLIQFDCGGTMSGTPARPVLDRVAFSTDVNDKRFEVSACFEKGARWSVRELRADRTCAR